MARARRRGRDVSGIVLLDKPIGAGSNEALQEVKRLFFARKAGHTGSLDRLAAGLLPICLGEATKLSGFLLNADKEYLANVKLGERTTTADAEGEVIERHPVGDITAAQLENVLSKFRGDIDQIPPMHSAIKVNGERLYKLAHQGKVIPRSARKVRIYELKATSLEGVDLKLKVRCSKGTYIRTLAEDIGNGLGVGARLDGLYRTQSGPFLSKASHTLDNLRVLANEGRAELDSVLLPMESVVAQWPNVELNEDSAFYIRQGQAVLVPHAPTSGWVRLFTGDAHFLGVGEVLDDGRIAPRRLVGLPQRPPGLRTTS